MSVFEGLSPPYSTIVADPPWHYEERIIEYGRERGAVSAPMPYSTMTNDEIARLPVMDLAAPGGLFAQTTEFVIYARRAVVAKRQVIRAGALVKAARESAGFNRSDLHRAVRGGKPTGIVFRWEADDCLPSDDDWSRLCEALPALRDVERPEVPPAPAANRSRIDTNWWTWPRSFHSVKPPAFLDVVEQVSPGPYLELFARAPRLGWDSWGKGYEMAS